MSIDAPILVTGAAGRVGGVGREVVEILRQRGLPVRALVRSEDERSEALRAIGAEVVVGDLTRTGDVARALRGTSCGRARRELLLPFGVAQVAGDVLEFLVVRRNREVREGRPVGLERELVPPLIESEISSHAIPSHSHEVFQIQSPQPDRSVVGGGGERLAVGREGDVLDRAVVLEEAWSGGGVGRGQVPEPDRPEWAVRVAAVFGGGGERLAVGPKATCWTGPSCLRRRGRAAGSAAVRSQSRTVLTEPEASRLAVGAKVT